MGMARRGLVASVALPAALLAACEKPVPKNPSFEVDVRPIFEAHCTRCHGAGGTLNGDPLAPEPSPPPNGFLGQYQDFDCVPDALGHLPADCRRGAGAEAQMGNIELYLHLPVPLRMPPPPSDPLPTWELDVVETWLANGSPETVP